MRVSVLTTVAALSFFMAPSVFADVTEGETSTIKFTGNITKATCSLDESSKNQIVPLGSVSSNSFDGGYSNPHDFSIKLTGCDLEVSKTASITFRGTTAEGDGTAWVTSDGDITKVGLQILQNGTPLVLDGSSSSKPEQLKEGESILNFAARYVALSTDVAPGKANADGSFTVNYE